MRLRVFALAASFAAMFSASSSSIAVEPVALSAGKYGFDWLHPESARCTKIGPKLRARFQRCKHSAEGGFTGTVPSYLCEVNDDIEYMVFTDLATCQKQLETMQANAP